MPEGTHRRHLPDALARKLKEIYLYEAYYVLERNLRILLGV